MCHPSEYGEPEPRAGVALSDVEIDTGGEHLPARLCAPAGESRGGVVIATDIFGANVFYRDIAARLAEVGIATLLPDLFFREGKLAEPKRELAYERRALLDDERALDDLEGGLDWLRSEKGLAGRLGSLGFCLGGNLVFHLAARRDDLATVAYYAFPAGLAAPKAVSAPQSIVDEMTGPILALWGGADEKVGMDNVRAFSARVAETALEYEEHVYPEADHGFLGGLGDPERSDRHDAEDSWARTLTFFAENLSR